VHAVVTGPALSEYASQWAAMVSIGASNAETLRHWVRRTERDAGARPGLTSDERTRLKALERENRELRQANEILRKASAYFAQAELAISRFSALRAMIAFIDDE
jgi:transposase